MHLLGKYTTMPLQDWELMRCPPQLAGGRETLRCGLFKHIATLCCLIGHRAASPVA
jgi:hypothetical protein